MSLTVNAEAPPRHRAVLACGARSTHWSSRLLAGQLGISNVWVARIWHKWGLQPWRRETFKFSTNPQLEAKAMVADAGRKLRAITLGPGGLFDAPSAGVLLVDSTVSAEATAEVTAAAQARGGDVLAAPVAGGPPVIPEGRLAIVCSGSPHAYARRVIEICQLLPFASLKAGLAARLPGPGTTNA